jgi:outer membrane protein W
MCGYSSVVSLVIILGLSLVPTPLSAQDAGAATPTWAFRTRAIMTGVSDASEPEGYKVYSGIAMEGNFTRALGRSVTLSWNVGTQSREVEFSGPNVAKVNLGSIELLPVDMMVQFQLRHAGRFRPYVGGGINLTLFWEKSGALDSTDLTVGVGPAIGAGFDYEFSPRTVFNVEFRAARLKTDLQADGTRLATLSLHPSTLAAGVGFRF